MSSYGLVLLIVAFIQAQIESGKSIEVGEMNLGKIFLEFLRYHGKVVNHSKTAIYAYPPNEKGIYFDIDKYYYVSL